MSVDATAAVLERLTAILPPEITLYDTDIPKSPPPRYGVLWATDGHWTSSGLNGVSSDAAFEFRIMLVASDPFGTPECRAMAAAVKAALVDWTPTVDGLVCFQMVHYDSQSAKRDESIAGRHMSFAVEIVSLQANRINLF